MQVKKQIKKKVFVGVSGGVDSSVSAALLIKAGYEVTGVFIRTWTPDFIECTWRDERRDAIRVCAHLGIPFLECDAEEAYKKGVADYMIESYKKGQTPNPDVMCNREVKFGVFWNFAKSGGADYIATGHYARIEKKEQRTMKRESIYELHAGVDQEKDQSYFLWTLTQEDLKHVLFPVGHLKKTQVRKLALKYHLPTAEKKDSQGVCFLGPLDMKEFLSHYIQEKKGNVLNEKAEVIGIHTGAFFLTIGERHGFTITNKTANDKPYYIVSKNVKDNTVTVSQNKKLYEQRNQKIEIQATNWITTIPKDSGVYSFRVRYRQELMNGLVHVGKGDSGEIEQKKGNTLFSPGQSLVVYKGSTCLGGGIIV